ncbi:MAG TPA: GAF domain-containing protein [Candidatus Dormibacteraeota bacterium]
MVQRSESALSGLARLLHGLVADFRRASGADIISLFLYDGASGRYYAPFATGQPEDSLLDSLSDMQAKLAGYQADVAQSKVPDDLTVRQYGSTVWLTVTRRALIARDAANELDSTFVRRHHVRSTVGLPLLAGDELMGIVYLNYGDAPAGAPQSDGARTPDAEGVASLQRLAAEAAQQVRAALARAEHNALEGVGRLTAMLCDTGEEGIGDAAALRRGLSIALAELLLASDLDAAAVYEVAPDRGGVELVTAHAPAAALPHLDLPDDVAEWESELTLAVAAGMAGADLHPAATLALGKPDEPAGYLVLLSLDPLASVRRAFTTDVLLRAAADLIGGVLASRSRIATLAMGNRLLGALAHMSSAMLRPGSSRQEVLDAVAAHLTDAAIPEFDFDFATVSLLEEIGDSTMLVRASAGASTSEAIASGAPAEPGGAKAGAGRVPRWVLDKERVLAPRDVLAYVARAWRVVLVGRPASSPSELIAGALPNPFQWQQVPVVRSDGSVALTVPACLIGEQETLEEAPFTLAGDIYETSGHADLIRLFLPFGLDAGGRATGVLEVGYHRSSGRRPDFGQVEALRAAAAQVAVAVETARLYENARRHAEQLELSADVSRAIASSIDLDQTLRLVARNLVRLVAASTCQIALYEEDGEGWYGAAASDQEDRWRRERGERPEASFLFEVLDRRQPVIIEDTGASDLVSTAYVQTFGVRSLLAVPLEAMGQTIGAAVLAQRDQPRTFTAEEVHRAQGLADQAAVAIRNARLHALAEEERHIQKDFVLVGLGQWGQRAYRHLQVLKQFFNFRLHVVEHDPGGPREELSGREREVLDNGDAFYWDSPASPADQQLRRELEPSCYVITYIATPAATHLSTLARYYDLSDVVLIEKPLGASPDEYRQFLDRVPGGVELVAADHYYFKMEVRLLQLLLTEERTLRLFLDSVQEVSIQILEAQPLTGAAADIGVVADLLPHALAIISLLTPVDHIRPDPVTPLLVGRHEPAHSDRETYARLNATFPYRGRSVRLVVEVGKGVEDAKWIRLSGERRASGRSPFYKFDFTRGEAIDGTQINVRAAVRKIREPGVSDNAHLTMLRHVIERRHPAVGILSIREAIRANVRIRELESLAAELVARGEFTSYPLGTRPALARDWP